MFRARGKKPVRSENCCFLFTLNEARASATAFSMKSSEICRDGCSLKTEFISAILAALRLASALVGQFYRREKQKTSTGS